MDNTRGFTLIEVLIAMFVSMVIMGGAYMFFNSQQRQTTIQTNVSDAQQTLRAAMDFMTRDVRMAGYNPDPDDFTIFEISNVSDVNGMSSITFTRSDFPNPITYSISTTSTLMYNLQPLAGNIIALGLAYAYDSDNDGELELDSNKNIFWAMSDGANWINLDEDENGQIAENDDIDGNAVLDDGTQAPSFNTDSIRAVRIWMLSQSEAPDPNYTDTNTYVVGPHIVTPNNSFRHRLLERTVLCRNLGLSL